MAMVRPRSAAAIPCWEQAAARVVPLSESIRSRDATSDRPRSETTVAWYRLGGGFLRVDADTPDLTTRFREVLSECRCDAPIESSAPRAFCWVRHLPDAGVVWARFETATAVDALPFILHIFSDRAYREVPSPLPGWRAMASADCERPLAIFRGEDVLLDAEQPWASLLGSYAFNRALTAQPGMLFFHAASFSRGGVGVMVGGGKEAGKSTLALTLASRGHDFLGDEVAALAPDGTLLPLRRAVSVRSGPRAVAVEEALRRGDHAVETFPDGAPRIRAEVRSLFPGAAARPAPLRILLLLRPLRDRPRLTKFLPERELISELGPLPCMLWGSALAGTMMRLMRLIHTVPGYFLEPGPPEATADLVEELLEAL